MSEFSKINYRSKSHKLKVKTPKEAITAVNPKMAVFMYGVQNTIMSLLNVKKSMMLYPEDFKSSLTISANYKNLHTGNLPKKFKFKNILPNLFWQMRNKFGISDEDFIESVKYEPTPVNCTHLNTYISENKFAIFKVIEADSATGLINFMPAYHQYMNERKFNSLLPKYLGIFKITIDGKKTFVIAIKNILNPFYSIIKTQKLMYINSFKDANAANLTNKEAEQLEERYKVKNDFDAIRINVNHEKHSQLLDKAANDLKFLNEANINGFSLLVVSGYQDSYIKQEKSNTAQSNFQSETYNPASGANKAYQKESSPVIFRKQISQNNKACTNVSYDLSTNKDGLLLEVKNDKRAFLNERSSSKDLLQNMNNLLSEETNSNIRDNKPDPLTISTKDNRPITGLNSKHFKQLSINNDQVEGAQLINKNSSSISRKKYGVMFHKRLSQMYPGGKSLTEEGTAGFKANSDNLNQKLNSAANNNSNQLNDDIDIDIDNSNSTSNNQFTNDVNSKHQLTSLNVITTNSSGVENKIASQLSPIPSKNKVVRNNYVTNSNSDESNRRSSQTKAVNDSGDNNNKYTLNDDCDRLEQPSNNTELIQIPPVKHERIQKIQSLEYGVLNKISDNISPTIEKQSKMSSAPSKNAQFQRSSSFHSQNDCEKRLSGYELPLNLSINGQDDVNTQNYYNDVRNDINANFDSPYAVRHVSHLPQQLENSNAKQNNQSTHGHQYSQPFKEHYFLGILDLSMFCQNAKKFIGKQNKIKQINKTVEGEIPSAKSTKSSKGIDLDRALEFFNKVFV